MRSWARRCGSVLSVLALCGWTGANPFGRYGFERLPPTPGFVVIPEGIRVDREGEPLIRFDEPLKGAHQLETDGSYAVYGLLAGGRSPTRLRVSAFGTGLELFFQKGFALTFQSGSPPFISWAEGSVGPEVPTPKIGWAAFSWPEAKVPLVVATPGQEAAWRIAPVGGLWSLESVDSDFQGWIRVVMPLGMRPFETPTASELARLAGASIRQDGPLFGALPRQREIRIQKEGKLLTMQTRLSQPGALVPPHLQGGAAGTPKVDVPTQALAFPVPEGATHRLQGDELRARMWLPSLPEGRAIVARARATAAPTLGEQPGTFARRSLSLLTAEAAPTSAQQIRKFQEKWISEAEMWPSAVTSLKLLYDKEAKQTEWLAALAVSSWALGDTGSPSLLSLMWAYDPFTGRLALPISPVANGLLSSGAVLSRDDAERWRLGTQLYTSMPQIQEGKTWVHGFLRGALGIQPDPWWQALTSPARLISGPRLFASNDGGGYRLRWWASRAGRTSFMLFLPKEVRLVSTSSGSQIKLEQVCAIDGSGVWVTVQGTTQRGEQQLHLKAVKGTLPTLPKAQD